MPHNNQLPNSLGRIVGETQSTTEDQIASLRETLEATQSALDDANKKIIYLETQVTVLKDNSKIKKTSVFYAKTFLILVPIFCLILLITQFFTSFTLSVKGVQYSIAWVVKADGLAQASLVIGPLVFIATVLGFLLRGVFGQSSQKDEEALSRMVSGLSRSE